MLKAIAMEMLEFVVSLIIHWKSNGQCIVVYTAMQSQKAVSAHFTSDHILPFGFAKQYIRQKLSNGSITTYKNQCIGFRR